MGWQKVNQGSWGGGNGSADVNALAGGGGVAYGWEGWHRWGTVGKGWVESGSLSYNCECIYRRLRIEQRTQNMKDGDNLRETVPLAVRSGTGL